MTDTKEVSRSLNEIDLSNDRDGTSNQKIEDLCKACQVSQTLPDINTNEASSVRKIYPTKLELSTINNSIQCTEENCKSMFTSNSNLNLHLYKTHNKKDAIQFDSGIKQFHCPQTECIYHEIQCFKNKKLLKQHYLKVHSLKTYTCEKCNEGFSSKVYKNMHVDYCGIMFKCNDCPIKYAKYESLLTHARRKGHNINEKVSFKLTTSYKLPILKISKSESHLGNTLKNILPKASFSAQCVNISKHSSNRSDQSIQTDRIMPKLKSKFTQLNRNSFVLKKDTRQTQTSVRKSKLTVETQTIGDYFNKKELYGKNKEKKLVKTQSSTQTNIVPLKTVSSNTLHYESNNEFMNTTDVKRSSSSTQTMIQPDDMLYSSTTNTHYSIHTDTSDLIDNSLENFDSNFFNCNMETQTDLMFNDDLFDNYCDYYSNMYTQTCEDMLLDSLELNNIETQTVDEMLRSVESQTMVSQNKKTNMGCRDISHMETQTDREFKQMLEAINA